MFVPHLHLCNRAGFRDNSAKSGKPGHNRDVGPNSGTQGVVTTIPTILTPTSYLDQNLIGPIWALIA